MGKAEERAHWESMDEEQLDEFVHDLKGQEAAAINNQGKEAQIAYIMGEDKCGDCLETG